MVSDEEEAQRLEEKRVREVHYWTAMNKMGLWGNDEVHCRKVLGARLTLPELKAIAFVHGGMKLVGTKEQVRYDLMGLLSIRDNARGVSEAASAAEAKRLRADDGAGVRKLAVHLFMNSIRPMRSRKSRTSRRSRDHQCWTLWWTA